MDDYYGEATEPKRNDAPEDPQPSEASEPEATQASETPEPEDTQKIETSEPERSDESEDSQQSEASEPKRSDASEDSQSSEPSEPERGDVSEDQQPSEAFEPDDPQPCGESEPERNDASEDQQPSEASGQLSGKKKRSPWSIVFVIALIVFIVSASALALIAFSYCQGQQKYDKIEQMAGLDVSDEKGLVVDWDALRAVNPDIVGWVYMPGTQINYPIVQGPDNDKYLTVDFDGDAGWLANYGSIFLDYRNKPDFSDKANFIYGHHMNDGSMFSDIAGLGDQARFDECRTIYLLTPEGNYKLRTFALLLVNAYDPLVQNEFDDDEEYKDYVRDKVDRNIVAVNDMPDIEKLDRVFAFITCDEYGGGRYVLYAAIEDKDAEGLSGTVGITEEGGEAVGFDDGLSAEGA